MSQSVSFRLLYTDFRRDSGEGNFKFYLGCNTPRDVHLDSSMSTHLLLVLRCSTGFLGSLNAVRDTLYIRGIFVRAHPNYAHITVVHRNSVHEGCTS